jgi:hypothetical protein
MRQFQTSFVELHRRLNQVLSDYQPISAWKSGDVGTYKATDASGCIYLVTISYEGDTMRRKVELALGAEDASRQTEEPGRRRPRPDEGWNLPPEELRSPAIEPSRGGVWYDKG